VPLTKWYWRVSQSINIKKKVLIPSMCENASHMLGPLPPSLQPPSIYKLTSSLMSNWTTFPSVITMKLLILIYFILQVIGQKTLIQDLPIIEYFILTTLSFMISTHYKLFWINGHLVWLYSYHRNSSWSNPNLGYA